MFNLSSCLKDTQSKPSFPSSQRAWLRCLQALSRKPALDGVRYLGCRAWSQQSQGKGLQAPWAEVSVVMKCIKDTQPHRLTRAKTTPSFSYLNAGYLFYEVTFAEKREGHFRSVSEIGGAQRSSGIAYLLGKTLPF